MDPPTLPKSYHFKTTRASQKSSGVSYLSNVYFPLLKSGVSNPNNFWILGPNVSKLPRSGRSSHWQSSARHCCSAPLSAAVRRRDLLRQQERTAISQARTAIVRLFYRKMSKLWTLITGKLGPSRPSWPLDVMHKNHTFPTVPISTLGGLWLFLQDFSKIRIFNEAAPSILYCQRQSPLDSWCRSRGIRDDARLSVKWKFL